LLWSSSQLTVKTKISVLVSRVFSFSYAAETWTIKVANTKKLMTSVMQCSGRILKVCWKDRVTNKSIRDRVKRHHTIVGLIKQRKLKLFGHIFRMQEND